MAKTPTMEMFAELEAEQMKAFEAAKKESAKKMVAQLKGFDFGAEETKLIEGLRNLYAVARKAAELGVETDFKPSRVTASMRGEATAGRSSGGSKAPRGEGQTRVFEFLKSQKDPQNAKAITAHLQGNENNVRVMLFNLVKQGKLLSFKLDDNGKYVKPKAKGADGKKERGGFYGLPD